MIAYLRHIVALLATTLGLGKPAPTLTDEHAAFLERTFARNRLRYGGFVMDARQRLADLRAEAAAIQARLDDGTATDEDYERAPALAGEIRTLVAELNQPPADDGDAEARAQAARDALRDLPEPDQRGSGNPPPGDRGGRPPAGGEPNVRDRVPVLAVTRAANEFTESQAYRDFIDRGMSGTAAVDVDGIRGSEIAMRATIATTNVPTRNPYVPGVLDMPARPLTILDMIDRQTTGLNSVPFIQEQTLDPTTGATEVTEGALKPEVDVQLGEVEAPVRTIAAWINVTRQAAEDQPTVTGFITGRLGFKVEHRLQSSVLNGNGTAPNLRGILNTVGIKTHAPGTAEARIISIRKAITLVQVGEYMPDTVVLAPADWELVELSTDNNSQFRVSPNVQNALAPRIWGLAVVVNTILAAGTACVGAFRLGATLWERHGVRVLMTDSHASNFTSNILTILAEMRAALTVWRPGVFCKITFNGTT